MNQQTTLAIVLRRVDYAEADRIVTVLSQDIGKIAILAKGVRRLKSKMAGGLELFAVNELTLAKGKGDLYSLRSARMKTNFSKILATYEASEHAFEALKQINRLIEDEEGGEYFSLLEAYLKGLNDDLPLELLELWWSLRLLSHLGHMPNLSTDVQGNKLDVSRLYSFDASSGTFSEDKSGVTAETIKLWRLCLQLNPQSLSRIKNASQFARESLDSLRLFVANHT